MDRLEKSERLIQAAAAILNAAPDNQLNIVILNKTLFYLDLVALRDFGEPVTHNSYIALANGPVVAKYDKRLVRDICNCGIATELSDWSGRKPLKLIEVQHPPDYLAPHAGTIDNLANHFSSSTHATNFSHENLGWEISWKEGNTANKPVAIDMLIAMQQIVDNDPWLHTPLSETEKHAIVGQADENESEPW